MAASVKNRLFLPIKHCTHLFIYSKEMKNESEEKNKMQLSSGRRRPPNHWKNC
jgi:hypothetical protein